MILATHLPEYHVSVRLTPKEPDMTIKRYKKEAPLLTGNQFLAICAVWAAVLITIYVKANL